MTSDQCTQVFGPDELTRYAEVLVWALKRSRSQPYKPGDIVLVYYDAPALDLMETLYLQLLEMGLHVVVRMRPTPTMEHAFYEHTSYSQLHFVAPGEEELIRSAHGLISILAPASLSHLASVEPERIGSVLCARKHLRDIMDDRERTGAFGWTLGMYPTAALAGAASLSLAEYARQVVTACKLQHSEATKQWGRVDKQIVALRQALDELAIKSLHVEGEGIDLHVGLGQQRRWLGLTGHNVPSFEIYTSPDWRTVEGTFLADLPSYRSGNVVHGVRLTFCKGQLCEMQAEQGEEFVRQQTAMDIGAARVGEFSLTDKRFSDIGRFMAHTLYDENHGGQYGNCHIAIGSSYPACFAGSPGAFPEVRETLGFNSSALHWDMVNTREKRVTATCGDGSRRVMYEDGCFTL